MVNLVLEGNAISLWTSRMRTFLKGLALDEVPVAIISQGLVDTIYCWEDFNENKNVKVLVRAH